MKRIVMCADDCGQNEAITLAIAALAASGRISAASCMADSPYWPKAAPRIAEYRGRIDIGLHFVVGSEALARSGTAANHPIYGELPRLIVAAYLRRLDKTMIIASLNRQLDRFEHHLGFPPDFIDGHQHVHQLPVVRDALLEVYEERLRPQGVYVRSTAIIPAVGPSRFKSWVISALGARVLARRLDARHIPHNADFGGVYGFNTGSDYRQHMRGWLKAMKDGGLIMCHPGLATPEDPTDPIRASRDREHHYLASDEFVTDCRELGVEISRARRPGR